MSNEAKSAFELGKSLYEAENYGEAISAFAKAVRLDPQNAQYRAWLARAWANGDNIAKVIEEATRAIQLDPMCSLAYRVRGWAYIQQEDLSRALEDTSRAIQIDPKDKIALSNRIHIHEFLQDYQNCIADRARFYEIASKDQYSVAEKKFDPLVYTIHRHFTDTLLPQVKSANERFIEYWPGYFIFNKSEEVSSIDGYSHKDMYGTYGTGYLCLTDKKTRVVSLQQLTRRFPGFKKPGVVGSILLAGFAHQSYHMKPEIEDRLWIIPNHSISAARISENHIELTSSTITCEISELIAGHLPMILSGINMAMAGKLAEIWGTPQLGAPARSGEDVIRLLKQLGELKSQGTITEAEFEQKKKELLSRL